MWLSVARNEPGILCGRLLTGCVSGKSVSGAEYECGSVPHSALWLCGSVAQCEWEGF